MRLPASYTGIVGFKPSWGVLSRWGLVSYAPALDVIGLMARSVTDVTEAFEALLAEGSFCKDSTTTTLPLLEKGASHEPFPVEGLIAGIPREWAAGITDEAAGRVFGDVVSRLETLGVRLKEISVPGLSSALELYSDFACVQASSTLARYNGVFFGGKDTQPPMWVETEENATFPAHVADYQGRHFGPEVLARIRKGRSLLEMRGRFERIQEGIDSLKGQFARVFSAECCDLVLSPTAFGIAPLLGSRSHPQEDFFTVAANLANLPAVSLPLHPPLLGSFIGTQLLAPPREDRFLLRVALDLERAFSCP
jgi:aspartyl-tRNA(Asn)/glutamyl-tRNA(Gln) amidotransferase subunit A